MPGPSTGNVVNNSPIVVGTTNQITSTYSGQTATIGLASTVVNSSQPLFGAYLNTDRFNTTGDGTAYPVVCNATTVNQGGAYSTSTGTFTAPVTGNYLFSTNVSFLEGGVVATTATLFLATSAFTYIWNYATLPGGMLIYLGNTVIVPLSAAGTASMTLTVTGSGKDTTIFGAAGASATFFSGMLLPA